MCLALLGLGLIVGEPLVCIHPHGGNNPKWVSNASAPAKKAASHSVPGASRLRWDVTRCVNDLHRSLLRNQPNGQVAAPHSLASSGLVILPGKHGAWADTRVDVRGQSGR